jgi:hypothetical protein
MTGKRLAAPIVVLLALAGTAQAQTDAEADAAGTEFVASKALGQGKAPADQWLGTYAGSGWNTALHISFVENDGGLRRIELVVISSHEKEKPERTVERWWVNGDGAIVKGDRKSWRANTEEPDSSVTLAVKDGKVEIHNGGEESPPTPSDLPAAFVPDPRVALILLSGEKKRWRFSRFNEHLEVGHYTIEDQGPDTIATRAGDVKARRFLVTEDKDKALYWVDDQHRIVAYREPDMLNVLGVAGTEEESRSDWWTRPQDDLDKAADRLGQGQAKLENLLGEWSYGIYEAHGKLKGKAAVKFAKEDKDGKPALHYLATTTATTSEESEVPTKSTEEWWFAADGKLLSASYKIEELSKDGKTVTDAKLRVDGDKMVATVNDPSPGMEEVKKDVPPHFVPDSFLLAKAMTGESKGGARFNSFDLVARNVYSVYVSAPSAEEEIDLPAGKVKARRVDMSQSAAKARIWIDGEGKILLVLWSDEDINVFGPADKIGEKLKAAVGPPGKGAGAEKDGD